MTVPVTARLQNVPEPDNMTLMLAPDRISRALSNPQLDVMNFLNEVALRFPDAISFAPGRPQETHFGVAQSLPQIQRFMQHGSVSQLHKPEQHGFDALGQYGRTNGIIGDLISQLLLRDEGIEVDPLDIVVTVGAQEAMCLCLSVLCGNPGDVALSVDPAYIGLSGAARLLGIEVVGIPAHEEGIDLAELERRVEALAASGKRARVLYLGSDYANPTGHTLTLAARARLLEAAERLDLLLLEDSAYNYFSYEGQVLPPLKSMKGGERVIFIGSFAKTVYPGLRVGYIAAGQRVNKGQGAVARLSDEISKAKSLLTVNTSPVLQAIVGGLLLSQDCSLRRFVQPRVNALKANRDAMLEALARHFPEGPGGLRGVSWNRPAGGFFLTMTLPEPVGNAELLECAGNHGVTWTPMAYFELGASESRQIRLSFSYVTPATINEGVARLAAWARTCSWAG